MTPKERILAIFDGQTPDVMPWFADLTYWYNAQSHAGILPDKYRGDGVIQLYKDLGCGAHEHVLNLPAKITYDDQVKITTQEELDVQGVPKARITTWQTPIGTLRQVEHWVPRAYTWAYREYPVKSPAELPILRYILDSQEVMPSYETQIRQIEAWGDWGVASSIPPRSPLACLFVVWMGVVNTVYAMADAIDEVEKTLATLSRSQDEIYEIIEQSPAPLVYFGENISSEVVGVTNFEKYYAPYYHKRVPGLHEHGKRIFVHVDGTLRGVLPLMGETGIDCVQSVVPAPIGDVAVEDLRKLAGPDVILWGGLPGALFSPTYPEDLLRDMVMECIDHHLEGAKFILGVADQVPPDGLIDRVRMVTELVEEHGHYRWV